MYIVVYKADLQASLGLAMEYLTITEPTLQPKRNALTNWAI